MTAAILSVLMGAVLGIAAHRAGLCTVKAAAEILTSGRGRLLWSFLKSALWVTGFAALAGALSFEADFRQWPTGLLSVLGGVVFGLGAGLNGGCTFSTLARAADGNLNMLVTVAGWPVGMLAGLALMPDGPVPQMTRLHLGPILALPLLAFALWEGWALARRYRRAKSWRRFLGAPVYTLSAAAAILGLANAVLLEATGPWSFTGTILCSLKATTLASCDRALLPWLILAASLGGMGLSAWQRGSFALRRPRLRPALRGGVGGVLMGFGAILIPGGNDGLILFGLPSLSPHAAPAYLGLLAGIFAALLTMRRMGRTIPPIDCTGDICRSDLPR